MSQSAQPSRRQALKLFGATPFMLPIGAGSLLSACGGGNGPENSALPAAATYVSASFGTMSALSLTNAAGMATTSVASTMDVLYSNGTQSYSLGYQPFFMTGDMVPDGKGGTVLAGGYVDINNKPIIDASVAGKERQFYSDSPDGTSLLSVANANVAGVKGKAVFAVVQFEYTTRDQAGNSTYGVLPSPIAVLTLDQDQTTGKLSLVKYHNVDTSAAHGLWITCGASLSPWGTHLSSEEYEPDAFSIASNAQFKAYSKNVFGSDTAANPYHYGHLPEVTVNPDGTGTIKKHYCLGRISHELIQVMPDKRTALMGDDYTNGGLFMFVADKEADLSAGTLYVAKYTSSFSVDPTVTTGGNISWINLGHATSAEIEALANTLKATDIMTVATTDPLDATFTKMMLDGKASWAKLKPGMEKACAFLETHRYANLVGASMGFTKLEGTTVNAKDKIAYSALQNVQTSMVKGNAANVASSNIGVDKQLLAGAVMAHTLAGGQKDTAGNAINSEWVPTVTKALLAGEDISADTLGNTANPDKIANPDNLKFSEAMRTLFIGEDSGQHVNNFVWAYNVDTKKLSRLMSMPAGAEATGLSVVDNLNGWTYITTNFQHAGDWSGLHAKVQTALDPLVRANYKDRFGAAVGYLTGSGVAPTINKA
ncbi:PhoX family phosphatase [Burkholderiaceae bacterium UC74_6]